MSDPKLKIRNDAPAFTALDRTAFGILTATSRDNRRRIVELSDERSLTLDSELCYKARADLCNPRHRVAAEVAWLPGLSPSRAITYCKTLKQDLDRLMELSRADSPLVRANVIAAALELLDPAVEIEGWVTSILALSGEARRIEPDVVLTAINEDRAVAGFPEILSLDVVEAELRERLRYYVNTIKDGLDRLPTTKLIRVLTAVVERATAEGGDLGAPLIDDVVDRVDTAVRPFLDAEAENIRALLKAARDSVSDSRQVINPLLQTLERVLRNWTVVARPILLSLKARGIDHELSRDLASEVRGLALELCNDHKMPELAQRITTLLLETFAVLPAMADCLTEDAKILAEILRDRDIARQRAEEWAKQITYEAQLGLFWKDTLRMSPSGIDWRGNRVPLETITRIGWGATRHSLNGIPTGTTYCILFGDDLNIWSVSPGEEVFSAFVDRLWKAVGVRLLTEMCWKLKKGESYTFGDAVVDDHGIRLLRRRLFGANESSYAKWCEVKVWSADGSFHIGMKDDSKAYVALPYQEANNAHVLEAAIRTNFKSTSDRLSSIIES